MADTQEKKYIIDNLALMAEWDWTKNADTNPYYLSVKSHKKVWWKCDKEHSWQASIANRVSGTGCPYCTNRRVWKGYNDLETLNPILASEWNYEKNGELTPAEVHANSNKRVWWKCKKGHEWQSMVYNRTTGCSCPVCNSERHTSFPEFALVFYLKKYGIEVIQSYKANGYELDIYIPSKKIAIEYDGAFWHKNKVTKDLKKNSKCQEDGIVLFRIRAGLPPLNDTSIDFVIQSDQRDLPNAIEKILREIIKRDILIDLEKDAIAIENLREYMEKENSLLTSNPILASEWNYDKNGTLRPEYCTVGSGKKVWWKCIKNHEWQATIASRNNGNGCPYCSGLKTLTGYNDLQTVNLALAMEWDYEKNDGITPRSIAQNSNKKVWWKCQKGHSWQTTIAHRSNGTKCPYCSGLYVIEGENDLQTINPMLSIEWNFEKNGKLTPQNVLSNSDKKVWWKCQKGHEWQATIGHRTHGRSCPYCARRKILAGFNDLQTINPSLAKEWDYEKNELTPMEVMPNSNNKAWWKCNKGHSWQAVIANRNAGCGCPYCAGRKT